MKKEYKHIISIKALEERLNTVNLILERYSVKETFITLNAPGLYDIEIKLDSDNQTKIKKLAEKFLQDVNKALLQEKLDLQSSIELLKK